jgi:hypothetical protein
MEQNNSNVNPKENRRKGRGLVGGLILILIGIYALLSQYVPLDFSNLALPSLGVVFIILAFATRSRGLLIPGGILSGIGAGAVITSYYHLPEQQSSGVLLLLFAAGWVLIVILSVLMNLIEGVPNRRTIWWPLIPAVLMAFIGIPLWVGGEALKVLSLYGLAWPILLIGLGVFILVVRRKE